MNAIAENGWAVDALNSLPFDIQSEIAMKVIGTEGEVRDAYAQMSAARHLTSMGFSIMSGNGRENTMKAQFKSEPEFWVVSCSLDRYVNRDKDSNETALEKLSMAKRRALKHCFKKIHSIDGPKLICINVPSEKYPESIETLSKSLFLKDVDNREGKIHGPAAYLAKKNAIVTGILVSYGDPSDPGQLEWHYHSMNKIDLKKASWS